MRLHGYALNPRPLTREVWATGFYRAYIWWCDDICDCHKPLIEFLRPNTSFGYRAMHSRVVWEGEYVIDGLHKDRPRLRKQLADELRRRRAGGDDE